MAGNELCTNVDASDIKPELLSNVSSAALQFRIYGSKDYPMIEVVIKGGASVLAEPGRMLAMPEGIAFTTVMGDGSEATLWSRMATAAKRMFSGESVILARFENETQDELVMRFGTVIPGNVLALNLRDYGGEIIGMSGVYLLGSSGLTIECCFRQKLGAAFFGGESFILQKIAGDGVVLLQGGGTIMKEELTPQRRSIRVDTGCLVAFTNGVEYNIALAGGLKSMFFGGEGFFLATLTLKPGVDRATVWLESFPYSRYISIIKTLYHH